MIHLLSITSSLVILCGALAHDVRLICATSQLSYYRGSITISVTSANHPVSGAKVTISQFRSQFDIRTKSKKTNAKGECTFSDLELGAYGVHIELAGYLPKSDRVAVGVGLFSRTFEYGLMSDQAVMGVITGTILDKFRKGIPKADVRIIQRNTGIEHVVKSNPNGAYEQTALVPGKYVINVEAAGYRPSKRKIQLATRQIVRQDFTLAASSPR